MSEDTSRSESGASILVVDDTPANLQVLVGMLKEHGHRVRPVLEGRLALRAARAEVPDLVLLDINMPDMNGFEVCEQLKADPKLADTPVIFISGNTETVDKVRAFSVGGVDYVTKPFQMAEVEARVATHLELRRKRRELQESYEALRRLETLRDSLVHMVVHDLRSPLAAISACLEVIKWDAEEQHRAELASDVEMALHATRTIIRLVNSVLDVSKMEGTEMRLQLAQCDVAAVARESVDELESLVGTRRLVREWPDEPVMALVDRDVVARIMQNLLGNALKFTPSTGAITVAVEANDDMVRVAVTDTGPGVPREYRERVFEKFGQVEAASRGQKFSTGLGLTFCRLAVDAHGGRIGVDSEMGRGSTFWFVLPRKGPQSMRS
ncbi:MAG: hybrid sensor histidine kinase/response regulator [Polyangia bacterium]